MRDTLRWMSGEAYVCKCTACPTVVQYDPSIPFHHHALSVCPTAIQHNTTPSRMPYVYRRQCPACTTPSPLACPATMPCMPCHNALPSCPTIMTYHHALPQCLALCSASTELSDVRNMGLPGKKMGLPGRKMGLPGRKMGLPGQLGARAVRITRAG